MLRARYMTRRDHRQVGTILKSFNSDQTVVDIWRKLGTNHVGMVVSELDVVEGFMVYRLQPEVGKLTVTDFVVADKSVWDEVAYILLGALEKKLGKRYSYCEIDVGLDFAKYFFSQGFYAVAEEDDVVRMQMWADSRVPQFRTKYSQVHS